MSLKAVIAALLALVLAVAVGWLAGASGRAALEQSRTRTEMRAEFADARAEVLRARVSLFESNFGNAIEACQNARNRIAQIQAQLRELGQPDQAGRLEVAVAHLSDAQQFAAAFDARAQQAASEALDALEAAGGGRISR